MKCSGISDKAVVLMADIFPTGYFAAKNAFKELTPKLIAQATVVVIGCGYVKLHEGELLILTIDDKSGWIVCRYQCRALQAKEPAGGRFSPITPEPGKVLRCRAMEFPGRSGGS